MVEFSNHTLRKRPSYTSRNTFLWRPRWRYISRTHIISCSLTPAKIREFKHMKVVRPEWLLESVNAGYLLPWKFYIYVRKELAESTQGAKTCQLSLVGQSFDSGAALSAEFKQMRTVSVPDPRSKADALECMDTQPSNQIQMPNEQWLNQRGVSWYICIFWFIKGYFKNSGVHLLWSRYLSWKISHRIWVRTDIRSCWENSYGRMHLGVWAWGSPTSKWKGKGRALDDEDRLCIATLLWPFLCFRWFGRRIVRH